MEIGLVSCTKSKRDTQALPRKLYDPSTLFKKKRAYCEAVHDHWYILSAKYGLLNPDGPPIKPYDETLTDVSVDQRKEWAEEVISELNQTGHLTSSTTFVIHAGKAYYDKLLPLLEEYGVGVELPTEGLKIGQKLAWYTENYE